jgi:hypothetical protein
MAGRHCLRPELLPPLSLDTRHRYRQPGPPLGGNFWRTDTWTHRPQTNTRIGIFALTDTHTYPYGGAGFPSSLVRVWQDGCEEFIPPCFTTWLLSVTFYFIFISFGARHFLDDAHFQIPANEQSGGGTFGFNLVENAQNKLTNPFLHFTLWQKD